MLTKGDAVPLLGGTADQQFTRGGNDSLWDGPGVTRIDDDTIRVSIIFETWPGSIGSWESPTLIDTGRTDTIALLLGEDLGSDPAGTAKLSLYVGRKNPSGNFLERNGLVGGTTYFWDADEAGNVVGTLSGTIFTGNAQGATGTWTTDPTEAVLFSKAEDVHTDMQPTSAGFGTRAVLACQGEGVFLVDFSTLDFVAGDLGTNRAGEVSVLFQAGTDLGDGKGQPVLVTGMDNLSWSADGSVYVNEDDGEGDVWQIRVADLIAARRFNSTLQADWQRGGRPGTNAAVRSLRRWAGTGRPDGSRKATPQRPPERPVDAERIGSAPGFDGPAFSRASSTCVSVIRSRSTIGSGQSPPGVAAG